MRTGFSPKWLLLLSLALVSWGWLRAQQQPTQQQPTYLVPVEMKGQRLTGSVGLAQHENEGAISTAGRGTQAGYMVETVRPGGPAATAGLLAGDVIVALDGVSIKGLDTSEVTKAIGQKKAGEKIDLTINRNGETKTLTAVVDTRKHLYENDPQWQQESKAPPSVSQSIFPDGSATIGVRLAQGQELPNEAVLEVYIRSKDAPAFVADDMKFFVLDGTGQQLKHVSLDEIKYGVQLWIDKNWRGGNYPPPPPPPPPQQYTLSGVQHGDYTITKLGGFTSVSGTSTGTYTATPQPDYSQLGNQIGYAIGANIRQHFDDKANKKLVEEANKTIASWEGPYYKGQAPMVPGEKRSGIIRYWTGSDRKPQPPYRVVLFFTDPRTQKEDHLTFAFGAGAEKIRDEMARQSPATSTQPKATVALTNSDVVGMVKAGIGPDIIVAKIKNTPCSFDTSPAALKELKDSGLADSVILAMVQAPKN